MGGCPGGGGGGALVCGDAKMGLEIGIDGGTRLARLSLAVGDIGEAVSTVIFVGLPDGTGGAANTVGGLSLLGGRLSCKDLSSSESSPGLSALSIRRCGGMLERAR